MNNLLCANCTTTGTVIPIFIKLLNIIKLLNTIRSSDDLISQIFGPCTFKLFAPSGNLISIKTTTKRELLYSNRPT